MRMTYLDEEQLVQLWQRWEYEFSAHFHEINDFGLLNAGTEETKFFKKESAKYEYLMRLLIECSPEPDSLNPDAVISACHLAPSLEVPLPSIITVTDCLNLAYEQVTVLLNQIDLLHYDFPITVF
jgi:hypothetical protein